MSTEYHITGELFACERSGKIDLYIDSVDRGFHYAKNDMDESDLRAAIVRLIHACSYISEDPQALLDRFNTSYRDTI